jgi:hypothetical protein
MVRDGRIKLQSLNRRADGGELRDHVPAAAQVAAALAMFTIEELEPERCHPATA